MQRKQGHRPKVPHYSHCAIEPKDFTYGLGDREYTGWCVGNILGYIARHRHKGTPIQDLEKAKDFIDFLIEAEHLRQLKAKEAARPLWRRWLGL